MSIRKRILLIGLTLLILSAFACKAAEPQIDMPNVLSPAVILDGIIYGWTSRELTPAPEESDYVGTITSSVAITEMPTEHGQANVETLVGTSYVALPEGIGIFMDNKWWILERSDD